MICRKTMRNFVANGIMLKKKAEIALAEAVQLFEKLTRANLFQMELETV